MAASTKLGSLRVRPVGLALNPSIDALLDQLWTVVRTSGHPTTRQEIVAALILAADRDPQEIVQLLNRYRGTDVSEVPIPGIAWSGPEVPKKPGRRRLRETNA